MCMGSSPPEPEAPAPAPPPPRDGPAAPVVNDTTVAAQNSDNTYTANRRGRNSLRIDLTNAGGSGPSRPAGLNLPV